jgi:hypothetical protein
MKKFLTSFFLVASIVGTATAENIVLEQNEQNCKKINGWAGGSREEIGAKLGVSMRSISFIRPIYEYGCYVMADTPKGPYKCNVVYILSGDKGKTAFASIETFGNIICYPR